MDTQRTLAFAGPFGGSSDSANEFYMSMFRNTIDYGIPASISVLINFGLNDKHIQYSADNLAHGCTHKQVIMIFCMLQAMIQDTGAKHVITNQLMDMLTCIAKYVEASPLFNLQ